ncbi:MAG: SUF system Fe-S cluster assembly regulator [Pseudomonadota bacterium]
MLRLSKMTDYATLVLAELHAGSTTLESASEIAERTGLGLATVSKILKLLARAKLVEARRGSAGGYRLARAASDISAAAIIDALEGPVAITECSSDDTACDLADVCNLGSAWQRINTAIRNALDDISLEDLCNNRNIPTTFPLMPLQSLKAARKGANTAIEGNLKL